jgi:hypothetical protein
MKGMIDKMTKKEKIAFRKGQEDLANKIIELLAKEKLI